MLPYVSNKVEKFYLINLKRASTISLVYGFTVLILKWLKYGYIKGLYLIH